MHPLQSLYAGLLVTTHQMYSIYVQLLCLGVLLAHGLDPGVEHLRLLSTLVIEPVLDPMWFQIRLSPNPPLRS